MDMSVRNIIFVSNHKREDMKEQSNEGYLSAYFVVV